MKKILVTAVLGLSLLMAAKPAEARRGFSIAFGPIGNVFLVDTLPIMSPGIGGFVSFDYRFVDQVAISASFMISSQNGTNASAGEGNLLLLGMPTFDVKYYLLPNDPRFDPFIAAGIGFYYLTGGNVDLASSTGGVGLGAQLGIGFDYFLTDYISLGFEGVFRSIGMITNLGTPSGSTSIFPYTLLGNVAIHF